MKSVSVIVAAFAAALGVAGAARAVDRFDIQVCDAQAGERARLACFAGLGVPADCRGMPDVQRLACLRRAAEGAASAAPAPRPQVDPVLPLALELRGGNFNMRLKIDTDCILEGRMESVDAGPSWVHLSEVTLSHSFNPARAALVCRDGRKCAVTTMRGDWDLSRQVQLPPVLRRADSMTLVLDYGHIEATTAFLEKRLPALLKACSAVRPGPRWQERLAQAAR